MDRHSAAIKANQARHNIPAEREHAIALKAAKTRIKNNPNAFKEMGKKGGEARSSKISHHEASAAA